MSLFGFSLRREKAVPTGTLSSPSSRGGWYRILEPFAGAWQRNIDISPETVLSFGAVYACVTLIASDIAKLAILLTQRDRDGLWMEIESAAFSPVLRKPNHYQTRIKFIEQWMTSKLIHGNAYVLKVRDNRQVVTGLYVLDPTRCRPLVSPDGAVFYSLGSDNLSGVGSEQTIVPASEIIHDVMVALYHPLCGVSPISACGLAAVQGLRVQNHSTNFFENGANPGGTLTAPGEISPETAKRLEEAWNANYGGVNAGKIAVLGDGLKYEAMTMSAVDAQLIDQLKWTAENVCTAYHVPAYMVGVAPAPAYNNIEALNSQYYSQCLQTHIESIELLLDEALGLVDQTPRMGTMFDLDALLRMDTATRVKAGMDAIKSGGVSPNEARRRFFDLGPVQGGESPYLQQQNYSLSALAKRDAGEDPFATAGKAAAPALPAAQAADEATPTDQTSKALWYGELTARLLEIERVA